MTRLTATTMRMPTKQDRWGSDHRLGEATSDLTAGPDRLPFTSVTLACRYRLTA